MVIYFLSGIPTLLGGEAVAMNAGVRLGHPRVR